MKVKTRRNKLLLATTVASILPIGLSVGCGLKFREGVNFYNYEDYIDPAMEKEINDTDGKYSSFGDLPELEALIQNQKVSGAIGSDYLIAKLAKNGKLKKIEFSRFFPKLRGKTVDEVSDFVKTVYTPTTWKIMKYFDAYLEGENHLWEYMIPYFIQSKVVAFRFDGHLNNKANEIAKHNWTEEQYTKIANGDVDEINALANENGDSDTTYKEIFEFLKKHNYSNLLINDYWRDNMIIGSEWGSGNVKNKFDENEAKGQIDGFSNTLKIFNSDVRNIDFMSSGAGSLNKLIGQDGSKVDVATLYNGDALYAYYSGDVENMENQIRVFSGTNSSFLIDGFIIPNYTNGDTLAKVYDIAKNMFSGAELNTFNKDEGVYRNFDYVNYTTPFAGLDNAILNKDNLGYFYDDEKDNAAEQIYLLGNREPEPNKVTWPINDIIQSKALQKYKEEFRNSIQ